MAANKKSSEKTAVCKIIANWFSCPQRQLTPGITLCLQTTRDTRKSLERKKCLKSSLHHLTPGPLPLHLALLPASAWQRLCPGLPKPTLQLLSETSSGWEPHKCLCLPVTSKEQTRSSFPAWQEKSCPPHPARGLRLGCRFCSSFSPSPLKSTDLCCWDQDICLS